MAGKAGQSLSLNKKIGAAKSKEIAIISDFVAGYRNREDTSLLKPQTLVAGSHDVLTNVSGRVGSRKGYTIDGPASIVQAKTISPFTWQTQSGYIHILRASFLTSGSNGKLQIRYSSSGTVTYLDLLTGLSSTLFNYVPYWDAANVRALLLFVNGSKGIWEWTGAIGTVSSIVGGLTLSGTKTLSQLGFSPSGSIIANGVTYPYTALSGNTFAGIIGDTSGIAVGTPIYQAPVFTPYTNTPVTISIASPAVFTTSTPHGYVADTPVIVQTSGTLPTGLVPGTTYYVIAAGLTATTFEVSATVGGSAVITSGTQTGNQSVTTGSFIFDITPAPPSDFTFDLISQINNQVFFASLNYNLVYMSQAGNYKNYSQSQARLQYEGEQFTTQGTIKAFIPEDKSLYISAGLDEWYLTAFEQTTITNQTTGVTLVYENAQLNRLKTTPGQASQSQALTTKIKNNIVYVSNEPIFNSLGTVADYLQDPQVVDLSYPIVNDMDSYDYTDGSVLYTKQYTYLAVPKNGLFRIYNMTNPKNPYWEAPQMIPLGGFSQLPNGQIIGHSYTTSESYILFNGYSDRAVTTSTIGNPISCLAVFAFQTEGLRAKRKSFNKFFIEGYTNANTNITVGLVMRSPDNGMTTSQTITVNGNANYVLKQPDNSLGKFPFGKAPEGTDTVIAMQNTLPSYFAVIKTLPRKPYLAFQPYFSSYGVNQQWELLSYGNNAGSTTENETDITV